MVTPLQPIYSPSTSQQHIIMPAAMSTTSLDPYSSMPNSPAFIGGNPYRSSMAEALAKTKAKLSEKRSSSETTRTDASLRDAIKKGAVRTTMFALPEDDDEDEEAKKKKIEEKDAKVKKVMESDMKIKFKIRCAKLLLRCLNFGCSLVVLSLVANAFVIFLSSRKLPTRNNLPAWAPDSILWPTYTTLAISCLSFTMAILVLLSYWRGGHKKAEKAAVWFTAVSVLGFIVMIILWVVVAAVITNAKKNSGGNDLWAWACNNNERKQLFQSTVDYDLVCKQLSWSLVCSIIEIVVESCAVLLYVAAFWRFSSKTRLRKSMSARDDARHELYLRKLANGDADVYRPTEAEMKATGDINLAERGYSVCAPPLNMTIGAPIIDPNSGLAINPLTGEATKPNAQ